MNISEAVETELVDLDETPFDQVLIKDRRMEPFVEAPAHQVERPEPIWPAGRQATRIDDGQRPAR